MPKEEIAKQLGKKYFPDEENIWARANIEARKVELACLEISEWILNNLWKPADGDDLPEYEREVVVFTQDFPNDAGIMKVAIAHRPDPKGWDGKSIVTGEVEHYTPKTYDKGGWNIPDVALWLDLDIPDLDES